MQLRTVISVLKNSVSDKNNIFMAHDKVSSLFIKNKLPIKSIKEITVKIRSFVFILTLFLTFGMAVMLAQAENDAAPENQEVSDEDIQNAVDKVHEVMSLLVGTMKGLDKLTKDGVLDKDKLEGSLDKMVDSLNNIEGVEVVVHTSSNDLDDIITDPEERKAFEKKVKDISEDEKLDDAAKKKKIFELFDDIAFEPGFCPSCVGPDEPNTSNSIVLSKSSNDLSDLPDVLSKILNHSLSGLDKAQLEAKLKETFKDFNFDVNNDDNVRIVVAAEPKPENDETTKNEVEELTERVDKLEDKLDTIIEKLDKLTK